jgi:hypothetical protein
VVRRPTRHNTRPAYSVDPPTHPRPTLRLTDPTPRAIILAMLRATPTSTTETKATTRQAHTVTTTRMAPASSLSFGTCLRDGTRGSRTLRSFHSKETLASLRTSKYDMTTALYNLLVFALRCSSYIQTVAFWSPGSIYRIASHFLQLQGRVG